MIIAGIDSSRVRNSQPQMDLSANNPLQQREMSVPKATVFTPSTLSITPKLKCFELLAIRQKYKAEKKAKKAQNVGEDETRLDTTVTMLDIDDIDSIRGTFKMKFKVHSIFKFDENKLKATVSITYL